MIKKFGGGQFPIIVGLPRDLVDGGNSATGSKKQPQETMIVFVHDSSGPSEALAENQREVWKHVAVFV